jgi:hypothetical protein
MKSIFVIDYPAIGDAHLIITFYSSTSFNSPALASFSPRLNEILTDGCFPEGGRVVLILLLVLLTSGFSLAQEKTTLSGERVIEVETGLQQENA